MNNSRLWQQNVISFFLLYAIGAFAQEHNVQSVVVFCNDIVQKEIIENTFATPIVITQLTFESDIVFQQEEFIYLMNCRVGDEVDARGIIDAIERFVKKNKFVSIVITQIFDATGVQLHLVFDGAWTFKKVKIHNVYQGKHPFFQYYLMERGDVFDEAKHDHSIIKIKEFLVKEGYIDNKVTSRLEYDNRTKEVIVHLSIHKGTRFCFGTMSVELSGDSVMDDNEIFRKTIEKKLSRALSSQYYKKELLHQETMILKDYLGRKGFLQVDLELEEENETNTGHVNLIWKITLYQKRAIVFFGHRFFSKKELLDKILAFGRSALLLPATLLAEEIVRAYKNKGFWGVEVVTQEEKERTFFIIKEGPRAIVKEVEIHNSTRDDLAVLKKQCFSPMLNCSYYDLPLFEDAIAHLTNWYVDRGFLTCVVVAHNFIPTDHDNEYRLIVTVDEGVRKYLQSVEVQGYPELSKHEFFKNKSNVEKPPLFDIKTLEEQRAWLIAHFQQFGYVHPRCKPIMESNGDMVTINWVVDLGEKVRFGKTVVMGSSTFPFSSISRLLDYQEGDLWNQEKIKQTFKSLKELEIFETIHFSPDYTQEGEEKPVIAKLQLDDRYEVRARAGLELQHVRKYRTFSGVTYKVGGTALIKNPSNSADQLRFDCDFARSHREIIGRYRRPWLIRYPFTTTLQVYSISYDQPGFIGSANDIYTLIQNGFFLGLQKKTHYCNFGFNNGFEWMKLHIQDSEGQLSFARAIDFKPQLIDKTVPFFFMEPTLMIERLDNALNPSCGGVGLFSLKAMVPMVGKYKDSFFVKALFEQSLFIPIRKVVTALRFRCGHIFYREFSGIMPSERFYLGGSHSLRSYEADLAPPLGIFKDDDGKCHVVPRGGRTMVNANIELRFPLYRKIGGVVFQDVGALSGKMFADFKPQDALAATGFGLRILTPLGSLRFDIGWKWRKQISQERSFAWFLTFGQAF